VKGYLFKENGELNKSAGSSENGMDSTHDNLII
jgi:hypothetical protein